MRFGFLADWIRVVGFLRRFKPVWRKAALANACGALASGLQLTIPPATIKILNEVVPSKDFRLLAEISAVMGIAALGAVVLSFLESQFGSIFRERANIQLEVQLFEHVQNQPYQFFKHNESGYSRSRLFNDASTTMEVVMSVTTLGRTLVWLLGGLLLLPYFHRGLGIVIIIVLPIYFVLLWWFNWRTKQAFNTVSEKTALTSREMYESMSGIYETKAYGAQKYRARRYAKRTIERGRVVLKARALMTAGEQTTQIITFFVTVIVISYGAAAVMKGQLSLGTLIGINALAVSLLFPINSIVQQLLRAQRSVAAIERTEKWISLQSEESEPGTSTLPPARGHIRYENVSFAYEGRPPVLRNVNFTLSPGQVMLLTGPSGVGKTTLVNLLPRFFEPLTGVVYLDQVPVTRLPLRYLRRQIAFVSQDVFLFSDSISSNIRMGKSSVSDQDIYRAALLANALEFIDALPDKFDTQVGERGTRLSGGQRQRIAIARAIVHDAPILVLDEATSAVDPETEAAVHEALCDLMRNKTTIIIAHHSTAFIEFVNRAFVLENGKLMQVPVSTISAANRPVAEVVPPASAEEPVEVNI